MDNKEIYQEMYKGAKMGVDSVEVIKNYITDRPLLNIINKQKREYQTFSDEIEQDALRIGTVLKNTHLKDKAMLWGGVFINTLFDKSSEKIAEIMVQGTNMGIISLTKVMNRYPEQQLPQADKLMNMYKSNLETLKAYL